MCFTNQIAETVACILLFRKSRHKPILESTSKYGFYPDLGGEIWRRSEHAQASYPGLSFRAPCRGWEERRVRELDSLTSLALEVSNDNYFTLSAPVIK